MASLVGATLLNPFVTGGLLYGFTRASPEIKQRLLAALAKLPYKVEVETVVRVLQVLVAVGGLGFFNRLMNRFAHNHWTLSTGAVPWVWNQELCVMTGGSGGLGQIVTRHLIKKGVRVAILDVQPPPQELLNSGKVFFYKCDITTSASVKEVADKIKKEHGVASILCNNAGIGRTNLITEATDANLDKIFKINLISHWYTVREFLPDMIKAKKGHIISTASMASYTTCAGMVDYCVTKAGAQAFTDGLNQEIKWRYKAPWIQVSSINPYWVKTALISGWVDKTLAANWLFGSVSPVQDPEVVAARIAKVILSGKGAHILLPEGNPLMTFAAAGRGLPHWLLEFGNDTQKDTARH
ncbi:hypothetical protein AMS68_002890 [Peltaster fructicola]|uniref:Uncharacterized protein n=1 Tax=Peltaster fructicola TaxID=286661 RepID=A0A6H0XRN9_9PEZI|nr:hypothetical protein AMS68_002890 [Peltaster fructicola]